MPFTPWSGSSSGGGQQPYQFRPETYGAAGNGVVCADVATNGTATITSPTVAARAAAGQTIMINGANGAAAAPLITTINSVTGTGAVLAAAAGITASNCSAIFGNDDTAAINTCITTAATFAQAAGGNYHAQILFGDKFYCLASGPTQVGDGSTVPTFNTQIPLPYPNANGTTQKLVLEFIGPGDVANTQYFQSTIPNLHGACLVSMVLAPGSGGLAPFGAQSIMGGPTAAAGFGGGFANIMPVLQNITFVHPWSAQQIDVDFRRVSSASIPNASAQAAASVAGTAPNLSSIPSGGANAVGFYMPVALNNDDSYAGQLTAQGIAGFGVAFSEHFTCTKLTCISCNVGAFVQDPGGAVIHGGSILYFSCENTNTALQAAAAGSTQFPIFIGLMDTEVINTNDIDDGSSILTGQVNWADFERTNMNVNVAGNLEIINCRLGPGHMSSPPAVPASGSSASRLFRPAQVKITTGVGVTVSAVTIDGTATGQTMAASSTLYPVAVPSGKTIALTYAGGTPTWDWWLS